jgi:DnaK suppressor protein
MNTEKIRQRIENEMIKTEQRIREYEELSAPVAPDDAIGRVSRMDAINNKSVTEAALLKARQKHNALQNSLAKVGKTDFGICISCKQPIPIERILFRPESNHCVKCAR